MCNEQASLVKSNSLICRLRDFYVLARSLLPQDIPTIFNSGGSAVDCSQMQDIEKICEPACDKQPAKGANIEPGGIPFTDAHRTCVNCQPQN